MASISFIEKLLVRLKSGDARSIHLNALPGNFARLDIYDLVNIDQGLHLKFLELLLTKNTFRFSITVDPALLNGKSAEEKKIIQKIIKRLNHLDYQEKEELSEHGYTSFGFGYPLFIRRDPASPERILKAPLLIWHLTLEKDSRKNNTWIISREEEQPLIFNELLQSHLESNERIKTDDLEELLEDNFLDERQLNAFCAKVLEKFNVPFNAQENIVTLLPGTNKASIELLTKETPWIRWSGIFGLYKMQKQSIIKDLERLIADQDEDSTVAEVPAPGLFKGEVLSPVLLDPSQENVLQQLRQHNNIIIQGPPGTGKSQSLTAIITQALLNKQKVLVVCEKRTAMEVLYNNLRKQQLHHLAALIEDVYSDRKHIVERVRELIENTEQSALRFRTNEYEQVRSGFLSLQEEVNHRINFTRTEIFGDDNWLELLGRSYDLNQDTAILEKANSLNKHLRNSDYAFTYEEFISLSETIQAANALFLKVDKDAFVFDGIHDSYFTEENNSKALDSEIILISDLNALLEVSFINPYLKEYGNDYDILKGFMAVKVKILSYFHKKYKYIIAKQEETIHEFKSLLGHIYHHKIISTDISEQDISAKFSHVLPKINSVSIDIAKYYCQLKNLPDYFNFRKFLLQLDAGTQALITALSKTGSPDWSAIFTTYYLNQTILKTALENGIKDDTLQLYRKLAETDLSLKQKLSEKINYIWRETIQDSIRTKDLSQIKYLYNQRKNKQFSSKNSLRKIIHQDFEFFTTLFPVLMVNPTVATSILPLQENLFDFIILDEASQLRLEDTYSSLLRGRTRIVSGDKHQMPPSNFFGNEVIFWNEQEEENGSEDFLAESKSLLEYTNDSDYKNTSLDFHYRSLHPDLIQFSNHAFYQSRLIPMPEKTPYQSVFYRNVKGVYTDGTNLQEAEEIVRFIYQTEKINGDYPGIGIATFNLHQRNLIFDKLYEQAYADKGKGELLQALLDKGLFVKNLENIQGDERDIMVLSTTFGKDEAGKFRQSFGPLTQEKGYQLLNVIITRARHSLYVFSSIPENVFLGFEEELALKGNTGKSIFYACLSYVKACSENNPQQVDFIKKALKKNSLSLTAVSKQYSGEAFKQRVAEALKKSLNADIRQNHALGGFILDIAIFRDDRLLLHIDFENTQHYHPEVTYRIKLHQDKMIRDFGITTYHLWSYNWWKDPAYETEQIRMHLAQS